MNSRFGAVLCPDVLVTEQPRIRIYWEHNRSGLTARFIIISRRSGILPPLSDTSRLFRCPAELLHSCGWLIQMRLHLGIGAFSVSSTVFCLSSVSLAQISWGVSGERTQTPHLCRLPINPGRLSVSRTSRLKSQSLLNRDEDVQKTQSTFSKRYILEIITLIQKTQLGEQSAIP